MDRTTRIWSGRGAGGGPPAREGKGGGAGGYGVGWGGGGAPAVQVVDEGHAEEAHRDYGEAGDRTAPQGGLQGRVVARLGGRRAPLVRADRDVHPDVPGDCGQCGPETEREGGLQPEPHGVGCPCARGLQRDREREHDGEDHGDDRDRGVLAPHERSGALPDRFPDFPNLVRARVLPQDVPREIARDRQRRNAGDRNHKGEVDHPPPPETRYCRAKWAGLFRLSRTWRSLDFGPRLRGGWSSSGYRSPATMGLPITIISRPQGNVYGGPLAMAARCAPQRPGPARTRTARSSASRRRPRTGRWRRIGHSSWPASSR